MDRFTWARHRLARCHCSGAWAAARRRFRSLVVEEFGDQLFDEFRRDGCGEAKRILPGVEFGDVGADELARETVDHREHVTHGQPPGLAVRDPGRERRVEPVQVDRDVHIALDTWPRAIGPRAHVDLLDAEACRLFAPMARHRPDADLHEPDGQALLQNPRERTGVREAIAFEFVIEIGVGVDLENGQVPERLPHRSHDRIRDRVIAAERDDPPILRHQVANRRFDDGPVLAGRGQIEIAGVLEHFRRGRRDDTLGPRVACRRAKRVPDVPGRVGGAAQVR